MNPVPHEEIVSGLKSGDSAAWQALFQQFAPDVWKFAARRMDGKAAVGVADVVQETMMAAAKSAATYDPDRGSLWSWLRGIASRQIALAYRTDARHDVLTRSADEIQQTGGELARWLDDSSDLPSDLLACEETVGLVHQALARLSDEYSDLLTAKYLDEFGVEQIASDQQATTTSVQSKLARARKAFRDSFDRTGKYIDGVPHE
jgi:RNA polymerase sigma-70 factor (ECF subfamily)